jgi:hypothetical protein
MHYKSPIPLLRHAGVDTKTTIVTELSKIKKGLLIELELSEEKTLRIDGQDLTKDDIISIFDDLKDDKTMQFHQWIYDSPYLLKLMQYGEISGDDEFFDLALTYHDDFRDFKAFVSPYLAPSLAKAITRAFVKRKFKEAQELMIFHYLIADAYFDEAFGRLRNSLKTLADAIMETAPDARTFQQSQFAFVTPAFIDFLNALPEQFTRDREAIVTSLIKLTTRLSGHGFPFHHSRFCRDLYRILQHVKCDEETQRLLFHNLDVFSYRHKKNFNPAHQVYLGLGIFLLLMLLRACVD